MILSYDKVLSTISSWIQTNCPNGKSLIMDLNNRPERILLAYILKENHFPSYLTVAIPTTRDNLTTIKDAFYYAEISSYSEKYNGIILNSINRNELNFTRLYKKYEQLDLCPLADLFHSEVIELLKYLNISKEESIEYFFGDMKITYNEIEWADRENERTMLSKVPGIIFQDSDPTKNHDFYRYIGRQKNIIAYLNQVEKRTRHKINSNIQVCKLRTTEGLVT